MSSRKGPAGTRRQARNQYDAAATKQALLKAAAGEFAKKGFRGASLRRICSLARTLPGSVHYHFGSKEALYREAIVESHRTLLAQSPEPTRPPGMPAEAALRNWIESALDFMILRRPGNAAGLLLSNELREPTEALTYLVENVMRPKRHALTGLLSELAIGATAEQIEQYTDMILSLVVIYEQCRPVLERFGRPIPRDAQGVQSLAEQITDFALMGMRRAQVPPIPPSAASARSDHPSVPGTRTTAPRQ